MWVGLVHAHFMSRHICTSWRAGPLLPFFSQCRVSGCPITNPLSSVVNPSGVANDSLLIYAAGIPMCCGKVFRYPGSGLAIRARLTLDVGMCICVWVRAVCVCLSVCLYVCRCVCVCACACVCVFVCLFVGSLCGAPFQWCTAPVIYDCWHHTSDIAAQHSLSQSPLHCTPTTPLHPQPSAALVG